MWALCVSGIANQEFEAGWWKNPVRCHMIKAKTPRAMAKLLLANTTSLNLLLLLLRLELPDYRGIRWWLIWRMKAERSTVSLLTLARTCILRPLRIVAALLLVSLLLIHLSTVIHMNLFHSCDICRLDAMSGGEINSDFICRNHFNRTWLRSSLFCILFLPVVVHLISLLIFKFRSCRHWGKEDVRPCRELFGRRRNQINQEKGRAEWIRQIRKESEEAQKR